MKRVLTFTVSSLVLSASIAFAGPQGFDSQPAGTEPQGFDNPVPMIAPMTVTQVNSEALDEQMVNMRGRLTRLLGDDKYEFTDQTGTIIVELDDDKDWSQIKKDQLIMISGEVDRDVNYVKIDVKSATPLER